MILEIFGQGVKFFPRRFYPNQSARNKKVHGALQRYFKSLFVYSFSRNTYPEVFYKYAHQYTQHQVSPGIKFHAGLITFIFQIPRGQKQFEAVVEFGLADPADAVAA